MDFSSYLKIYLDHLSTSVQVIGISIPRVQGIFVISSRSSELVPTFSKVVKTIRGEDGKLGPGAGGGGGESCVTYMVNICLSFWIHLSNFGAPGSFVCFFYFYSWLLLWLAFSVTSKKSG